jgi:predicted glycosyltransferase involved in capsule biosynthesis
MLLSILIPGKNDNFRYNGSKTLELNLNQSIDNLNLIGVDDIEIVLCDWGSENKIIDHVVSKKHKNFKCVYVRPEIANKYNGKANYSIVHPINTAFRKSLGEYVAFWDSDCFVQYDTFISLYSFVKKMKEVNDMKFYWGSRYHVPYEMYTHLKDNIELSKILKGNNLLPHDKIGGSAEFRGASIILLMNRLLWESSSGWYEKLPYWGWQDIEFHNRLLNKYEYGGDLEDIDNMKFYHLNQPVVMDGTKNKHLFNQSMNAPFFYANDVNWGLADEDLEIIQ